MSIKDNLSNACTKTLITGLCFGLSIGLFCMGGLYYYLCNEAVEPAPFFMLAIAVYFCGEWFHKKSMDYVYEVLQEVGE